MNCDVRCRVACHKHLIKNELCHCANRIEDESPENQLSTKKELLEMEGFVTLSDEVTEIIVPVNVFENRNIDESDSYPYVTLCGGKRFYYNRFLYK